MREGMGHLSAASIRSALALVLLGVASGSPSASAQERPVRLDTLRVEVGSRVSSRLPALTRSLQLLTRDEIAALPVRTVSELLEWATGVEVLSRSPAQSDLSIRGAGFEQVLVLVNGVRMSDPQTGHFDLNLAVPLSQVERVEVLRGPASALYGADAVGGVVNIVTRQGGSPFQATMEGGSWGTGRLSLGGGVGTAEGASLQVGGELSRSDGHRPGTDFEAAQLHVRATAPVAAGRLSAELGVSHRDFGAQDFYAPFNSFEKTRSYDASLHWIAPGGSRIQWETRASIRRHDDEFILMRDDPDYYLNDHTSYQGGGELLGRTSLVEGLDLAVGGEVYRDVLRSSNLGNRAESRGAVFSEVVVGRGGSAILSAGIRNDWHQGFGSFASPSLSGSLRVASDLRLRGALGRSFRSPTWTERYYQDPANVGRPDLDPERAWSGEVGVDLARGALTRLSVTGFYRRSTSLIDWARPLDGPEGAPWETRNVEEATFKGLEADVEVRGPLGLSVIAGGALLSVESEESEGFVSKYALRPITERVTLGIERALGERAVIRVNGQRGKRTGEDPYHRIDFRGSIRVGPGRLYLDAKNVTDTEYPDVTGALAPGRALYLGFVFGPPTPAS